MGYHDNEWLLRAVVEDAQKFINDRARLEEGFRRTLMLCTVPAPDIETVIADCRRAQFDSIAHALQQNKQPALAADKEN